MAQQPVPGNAVIFVFAMEGCGPCEEFVPRFQKLAQRYVEAGLPVRVCDAASEDPALVDLMERHGIAATPTVLVLKRGAGSLKIEGSSSDAGIEQMLQTAYRAAQ